MKGEGRLTMFDSSSTIELLECLRDTRALTTADKVTYEGCFHDQL